MVATENLYRRADSPHWFVRFGVNGREVRLSTRTADLGEACRRRDQLVARHQADGFELYRSDWRKRCRLARVTGGSWLRIMCAKACERNKGRGWKPISLASVYRLALKSRGRCAVTGIPFAWTADKAAPGPYAISLDRITPRRPYSPKNCRMVLRAVNLAMSAWGSEVFWEIAGHAIGRRLLREHRTKIGTEKPLPGNDA